MKHDIPGFPGIQIDDARAVHKGEDMVLRPDKNDGRVTVFFGGIKTRRHPDDLYFAATGVNDDDMDGEQWSRVDGFPNYEVSDAGRVRSWAFRGKPRLRPALLSCYPGSHGYPVASLYSAPGEPKRDRLVHRLVLSAFVSPCPPRREACHADGDRTNNRLENLRWGTAADNTKDKQAHGRVFQTLTEDGVREIRRRGDAGESFPKIAVDFGISRTHAWRVATRRSAAWVNET